MPYLKDVSIQFDTHDDGKDADTIVHVFVRNRLNSSLSPEGNTDFISNLLESQRYLPTGDLAAEANDPYLAIGVNLAPWTQLGGVNLIPGMAFDDPSSHTFSLPLRSSTISVDDIVMPSVSIHILPNGDDRWIFDYTVTLTFDDGRVLSFTSKADGVTGIILDQDNRNHSGIGIENRLPPLPIPAPIKPVTSSLLKRVTLEFATHNSGKDADTRLNAHIVNRISETSSQDLAIGLDILSGQPFPDAGASSALSYQVYQWAADPAPGEGTLASGAIRLADMVLPVVDIDIVPNGNNRWIFDYQVTFEFGDSGDFEEKYLVFSSRTNGVILDQKNNKHSGAYQGRPFPTVSPPTAPPLISAPVDHVTKPKTVPLAFLRSKLAELVTDRNGTDTSPNPPVVRIRLHNSGSFPGSNVPETYADKMSITAGRSQVYHVSSPRSLGPLMIPLIGSVGGGGFYLDDVNSATLDLTVDATSPTPFTFTIDFETDGPEELVGIDAASIYGMKLSQFSISLSLTLDLWQTVTQPSGAPRTVIDVMSWVREIQGISSETLPPAAGSTQPQFRYQGTFLKKAVDLITTNGSIGDLFTGQVIKVTMAPDGAETGFLEGYIRDKIFSALSTPDIITKRTDRDAFNSQVTSWLLGGVADDDANTDGNNAIISSVEVDAAADAIVIKYTGPKVAFAMTPPVGWPAGHDFSPGTLAPIDHIVVLTMENRSFDHMLGYLRLPEHQGGAGRADVDGLQGGESNPYQGKTYPSVAITDTYFPTDPPHSHEPVTHAINGGRMDGFVQSYADAHGSAIAGQIMGHQTAAGVPTYDALSRDFAIGHRWFSSHPGPTFCNRFYELTGRLNLDPRGFWELDNSSPLLPVYTATIFDHLDSAKVTWAYFEHGYCFLRFFEGHTFDGTNIVTADDPNVGFFARAAAGALPSVSFIDPHFIEYPPNATCDGPPSDVENGQKFVARVVEALIAGPAWNKTLLLITYDENGGFYDHVPPPAAPKVSPELPVETLGVRVPAIVVSPWVAAGSVFGHDGGTGAPIPSVTTTAPAKGPAPAVPAKEPASVTPAKGPAVVPAKGPPAVAPGSSLHFDHTSILKTIARRFLSQTPPYMGARYAAASDLSAVLGDTLRQPPFFPFIRYNLEFDASKFMLDVRNGLPAASTVLQQYGTNGTVAQDFSFEDAGGGYFYIRSHVSSLYVTVQGPATATPGSPVATTTAATTAPGPAAGKPSPLTGLLATATLVPSGSAPPPPPATAPGPAIIQDVKYTASGFGTIDAQSVPYQKWKLSPVGNTPLDTNRFLIESFAHPGKVLRPADPTQAGSPIVLGDASPSATIGASPDAWTVTSPLLSANPTAAQPATPAALHPATTRP